MAINFETVGKRIKEVRKQKAMSQDELAERADLSSQYISQIETGRKKGSLPTYNKLAKALGVSIDELTGSISEGSRVLSDVDLILQDCSKEERELLVEVLRVVKGVVHGKVVQESSRNDSNTIFDKNW